MSLASASGWRAQPTLAAATKRSPPKASKVIEIVTTAQYGREARRQRQLGELLINTT
jgi:hypothetical protein